MAKPTCTVGTCPDRPHARGWCRMHYVRWQRGGDPAAETIRERAARLRAIVEYAVLNHDRTVGCWTSDEFTSFKEGYPVIGYQRVSHLALTLDGRLRPGRLHALHSCDVPTCFNPDHLRWGTRQDNVADRVERGRSGNTKLTETAVREIRARYAASGISQETLAAEYGVNRSAISRITTRQLWKHLN